MGHEIGHVLQRHIARSLEKQGTNSVIALASIVLGALAAASNPSAAVGLITGGQALAIQNQLAYSRDAERESDRIGFQILQASGYDVNGAPAFFQRLQNSTASWIVVCLRMYARIRSPLIVLQICKIEPARSSKIGFLAA